MCCTSISSIKRSIFSNNLLRYLYNTTDFNAMKKFLHRIRLQKIPCKRGVSGMLEPGIDGSEANPIQPTRGRVTSQVHQPTT
jgi:hypothetical protein